MPDALHVYVPPADATFTALQGPAAPIDPAQAVSPRTGATIDATVLRVLADAAVKQNAFTSAPGYPSARAHWQTHLHVVAHDGALVASTTRALGYARPAGDGGDVFHLDEVVYEGTTVTLGSAEPRPDARLVQYRIYGELAGQVFTDGRLHAGVLKADVASR
jgi:hypothetical protein